MLRYATGFGRRYRNYHQLDGTAITISSPNSYRYVETDARGHRTFYAIEGGLSPDVEISYSEYYTDAQLKKYLESIN